MHTYTIIENDDGSANVLLLGHGDPLVAHSSHVNYQSIVDALHNKADVDFVALFDTGEAVKQRFQALSERVSVDNGHILLDGDVVDDSLTEQIVRFLDEGIEDWKPLVNFLENVASNPQDDSKEQLYDWLRNQEGITITSDGLIVGYKGVRRDGDGSLASIHSGQATVQRPGEDPAVIKGRIPNEVGSVITMPRSEVVHDPAAHCHRGLHVGTQRYAASYASGGVMLEVHVNPRDVVSVPNDARGEKIRVCRYTVVKILEDGFRYTAALRLDDAIESLDEDVDDTNLAGLRVIDSQGDEGVIIMTEGGLKVEYDEDAFGSVALDASEVVYDEDEEGEWLVLDAAPVASPAAPAAKAASAPRRSANVARNHGKGGPTSLRAKGNGRNPAQGLDGKFTGGRPGSQRSGNGRFTG